MLLAATFLAMMTSAPLPDVAVMVHGAGGGGWEYDLWKPVYEKAGWKVIAPDLLPAEGGLEETRFDDYVNQVASWVPEERRRCVFIGASLGGILVLKVAEKIRPDAIVLVNSVAPKGIGPAREAKEHPPIVRWANGPLQDTHDAMPDSDEKTILWAHPQWRDESGAVLNAVSAGIEVTKPASPVLVVLGENDTDISPATGMAIAKWAGADVVQYAATSHVGPLMGKRAGEIAEATERWIRSRLK